MANRESKLIDHEIDGIREYDNPTPGWWHALFMGSVLFSIFYGVFFHTGSEMSWTVQDTLTRQQQAYYKALFKDVGELQPTPETFAKMMKDEKWMAFGSALFGTNCAACHGAKAQGITGPNLTDSHWKNVNVVTDIYHVVSDGVVSAGMPMWKNRLSQNERVLVASYVASLRSSPVSGGRGPEGKEIPEWNLPAVTSEPAPAKPAQSS